MLTTAHLIDSVGAHCPNHPSDVLIVQELLNRFCYLTYIPLLREDGQCGIRTIAAIHAFQRNVLGIRLSDGVVSRHGPTLQFLAGQDTTQKVHAARRAAAPPSNAPSQLTDADFQSAATRMGQGIDALIIAAFAQVESGGKSGFGPDQRPIIAYEGHVFRRLTGKKYDQSHPFLSYPYVKKAGSQWKINNRNQETAWKTLETAVTLDHNAAIQSCSWGMFQVMGEHYSDCGYESVDEFVFAMKAGERGQLDAFVGYCIKKHGMLKAMSVKDFSKMALLYNGEDYGDYDRKISIAYKNLGGD